MSSLKSFVVVLQNSVVLIGIDKHQSLCQGREILFPLDFKIVSQPVFCYLTKRFYLKVEVNYKCTIVCFNFDLLGFQKVLDLDAPSFGDIIIIKVDEFWSKMIIGTRKNTVVCFDLRNKLRN